MNTVMVRKILAPLVPYITISIGLLVFHNAWLAMLGYHAGMVAVIIWSKTGLDLKRVFKGKSFWTPFIGALIGLGGGLLLYFLWPILSLPDDINIYIRNIGLNEWSWPVFLVYFIVVNPFLEERYWRGYLGSEARGIQWNDLLFSGYHLIVFAGQIAFVWLIAVFVSLTIGAWFWRQLNRLNGGLLASIVSHLAADIVVILTIYWFSSSLA